MPLSQREIRNLVNQFIIYGDFLVGVPFGNGNVNDTYQLTFDQGGLRLHYILQRVNKSVFPEPEKLMDNVERVTDHILKKIREAHLETQKRTLRLLRSETTGKPYISAKNGDLWRAYVFVEHARAYEVLESPEQAFKVASAFGQFQLDLVDFDGRLHETIPNFHNTVKRYEQLEQAIAEDRAGRLSKVQPEVDFVMARKEEAGTLLRFNASGDIPERITHNDTKANNILMDDLSGNGICVLDLDTVMPGLSLYDFGDMVRSGTNAAEEDEIDLSKVGMRFDMYEAFHKGFMSTAGGFLTPAEREMMPFSGKLITLEIGIRFLADYLNGDIYFRTRRPHHNLDRARNQFKMVESIESQYERMMKLVKKR